MLLTRDGWLRTNRSRMLSSLVGFYHFSLAEIMQSTMKGLIDMFASLFVMLLYVPSQQLWSWRGGGGWGAVHITTLFPGQTRTSS